jgi:hypothetical protein
MRNYLYIILFIILSLTIPFTSAYAYGGGGGGGSGVVSSIKSDTTTPPSGFTPTNQESAEIKTSSEKDPGNEEKVSELVEEVKAMEEEDSKDSAEETTSDEEAADDDADKKNVTIGVRRFLSQLTYALPQGMQPAVDAVDHAADRAQRVKHINNFFDKYGFTPPDLSDDKNLVKVENLVKEAERTLESQDEINKNLAAAQKYQKEREALQRKRDEQLERTRADARAIVKFGMDVTVTFFSAGVGGYAGPATSIVYSAATSDNPLKGGAVQAVVEVATPPIAKSVKPIGRKVVRDFGVNFGLAKTEEATEYGLSKLSGRQQQRNRFGQQTGQSIDTGAQSVPPSK